METTCANNCQKCTCYGPCSCSCCCFAFQEGVKQAAAALATLANHFEDEGVDHSQHLCNETRRELALEWFHEARAAINKATNDA